MRKMRRKDRAMSAEDAYSLLENAEYGVLSTVSANGMPYGVPLNYCLVDSQVYVHCAVEGHKIDNIKQNKQVSFCVVGKTKIVPNAFTTEYESTIVFGEMEEVQGEDKRLAMEELVRKYSPEFEEEGGKIIEKMADRTKVLRIRIERITGKANKK